MSDVTAIDSEERDQGNTVVSNGDNSIPRGDDERIIKAVAGHMAAIMAELKLDLDDPNYEQTPERVAKMYLEMFHGLREGAEPKITTFPNDEGYHHMVIEREIPFYSMCAHHLVPFYGHAHIAYIPEAEVIGLSKLPRILGFYAKRPQLQERLTEQVAGALTTTSALRGCFADRLVREEFLALLRRQVAW